MNAYQKKEVNDKKNEAPKHFSENPTLKLTAADVAQLTSFSLTELLSGIFSKLNPLFSIDCAVLTLYDKSHENISEAYLSNASCGEFSSTQILSEPLKLSSILAEIASFDFPVLKSRQDWINDYGKNHVLERHAVAYNFHCYIPIEYKGEVLGTFELHNLNQELSVDGLSFCCTIAEFFAGLLLQLRLRPFITAQKSTGHFFSASINNLIANFAEIDNLYDAIAVIEAYYLKCYKANYVNILRSNDVDHICDPLHLTSLINFFSLESLRDVFPESKRLELLSAQETSVVVIIPLNCKEEVMQFVLGFAKEDELDLQHQHEIASSINLVVFVVDLFLNKEQLQSARKQLDAQIEKMSEHLLEEISIENKQEHPNIIGSSAEMNLVYRMLGRIAGTETTVLILGETGTGKELIAKAIHEGSQRAQHVLIKVNCASIPPNLIESELFGHEKGSFTGATERRIGKFELANGGTIFLDEIGELTLDLQVKLLRVLQEKEIERVGGQGSIPINVRVISATNRDLLSEVETGKFRSDLFYRLNVFPLSLPPLRHRKADIPHLASYFLNTFANKTNRKIAGFSKKAISKLQHYHWPGNVRELEHLIERQVVLTNGPIIKDIDLPSLVVSAIGNTPIKTIAENEREHILSVLQLCNGKISGINGAAKLLGVPATTLNSKIKKLGLAKKHIF